MSKLFKPCLIKRTSLDNFPIAAGQLIVCPDSGEIFIDISNSERKQHSLSLTEEQAAALNSGITNELVGKIEKSSSSIEFEYDADNKTLSFITKESSEDNQQNK